MMKDGKDITTHTRKTPSDGGFTMQEVTIICKSLMVNEI
jgi:hypothetical protein